MERITTERSEAMAKKFDRNKTLIIHVSGGCVDVENAEQLGIAYEIWDHDNCEAVSRAKKCPDCKKESR